MWHSLSTWLADYYLSATILLAVALAISAAVRQPVKRIALAWGILIGLVLLAMFCAAPFWPRLALVHEESHPQQPAASDELGKHKISLGSLAATQIASQKNGGETPPPPLVMPGAQFPARDLWQFDSAPRKFTDDWERLIGKPPAGIVTPVADPPTAPPIDVRALIGSIFLCGSGFTALWLLVGAIQTHRLCRRAEIAPAEVQTILRDLVGPAQRMPRLMVSDKLDAAAACGLWRPTILLPSVAIQSLCGERTANDPIQRRKMESLRMLLAHEWSHIRRRDLWLLSLSRLLLPLLYAHPLLWWLRRRVRADQELIADALVAETCDRHTYAENLLRWARRLPARWPRLAGGLSIGDQPHQLSRRIAMLIDERIRLETACGRRWRWFAAIGIGVLIFASSLFSLRPVPARAADDLPPSKLGYDLVVSHAKDNDTSDSLPEDLAKKIEKLDVVDRVIYGLTDMLSFPEDNVTGALILGCRPEGPIAERLKVLSGRQLQKSDERRVMIGKTLAANMNKNVGDTIPLYGSELFKIVAVYESPIVFENDGLVVPLKELQQLMNCPGEVTGFSIAAKHPIDKAGLEKLAERIRALDANLKVQLTAEFWPAPKQESNPAKGESPKPGGDKNSAAPRKANKDAPESTEVNAAIVANLNPAFESTVDTPDAPSKLRQLLNQNFEMPAKDGHIPGWVLANSSDGSIELEPEGTSPPAKPAGKQAAKFKCTGSVAMLCSEPFTPPTTGQLSISVWLRIEDAKNQPQFLFAINGRHDNKGYYHWAQVGQGTPTKLGEEWQQWILPINDLPTSNLDELQVRFDIIGPGCVWIDDVQLSDVTKTARPKQSPPKQAEKVEEKKEPKSDEKAAVNNEAASPAAKLAISGTCVTLWKKPIPGAVVKLYRYAHSNQGVSWPSGRAKAVLIGGMPGEENFKEIFAPISTEEQQLRSGVSSSSAYVDPESQRFLGEVRCDDQGKFAFPEMEFRTTGPAPEHIYVVAQAPGMAATACELVTNNKQDRKEVLLMKGGTLSGRIFDAEGKPVARAIVSGAAALPTPTAGIAYAVTDAEGRYELHELPTMDGVVPDYTQGIEITGWETAANVLHPDFAPGMTLYSKLPAEGNATLVRPASLQARVVLDESGLPVTKQGVQLVQSNGVSVSASTDADGNCTFARLTPGKATLTVWPNDRPRVEKAIEISPRGENKVEVRQKKGGFIKGRIVEDESNEPSRDLCKMVIAISRGDDGLATSQQAGMDGNGNFTMPVPTGKVWITVFPGLGYSLLDVDRWTKTGVEVAEGESVEVELRLAHWFTKAWLTNKPAKRVVK